MLSGLNTKMLHVLDEVLIFSQGATSKWTKDLMLRVVIDDDDIRKLTLNKRPDSIEELKTQMKDKLSLQYDVRLQYEDPDFNNALCNLTQITDLPERATLKVIPLVLLELTSLPSSTQESDCFK